jgi:nucleotide-binding universal stress UspA family protein
MKTILIPVDFSKESEKALSVGAKIAKRITAKLILTHMADLDTDSLAKNPVDKITEKRDQSKLTAKCFQEFLKKYFLKDVLVEPIMQDRIDFDSISSFADDISADLIVMGSNGSNELKSSTIGSNTEKVVSSSKVPVLVVKKNELNFSFETLLFVSDFMEESLEAYQKISAIAATLQAKMSFLYINLPNTAFKSTKQMDEILFTFFTKSEHPDPVAAIKTVHRYADFSIEEGIYNFSSLSAADIIAIPTHGREGISHVLHKSISGDVANHSIIPVLTVRI